jgi:hypothetical protein
MRIGVAPLGGELASPIAIFGHLDQKFFNRGKLEGLPQSPAKLNSSHLIVEREILPIQGVSLDPTLLAIEGRIGSY